MITKKVIAPLIVVIVLSGIGGVLTAKTRMEQQLAKARAASEAAQEQSTEVR